MKQPSWTRYLRDKLNILYYSLHSSLCSWKLPCLSLVSQGPVQSVVVTVSIRLSSPRPLSRIRLRVHTLSLFLSLSPL